MLRPISPCPDGPPIDFVQKKGPWTTSLGAADQVLVHALCAYGRCHGHGTHGKIQAFFEWDDVGGSPIFVGENAWILVGGSPFFVGKININQPFLSRKSSSFNQITPISLLGKSSMNGDCLIVLDCLDDMQWHFYDHYSFWWWHDNDIIF